MAQAADLIGRPCVAGMSGNPPPPASWRSQNPRASEGRAARFGWFTAPAAGVVRLALDLTHLVDLTRVN